MKDHGLALEQEIKVKGFQREKPLAQKSEKLQPKNRMRKSKGVGRTKGPSPYTQSYIYLRTACVTANRRLPEKHKEKKDKQAMQRKKDNS